MITISETFSFMDHKNFNQIGWEVLDFDSDLDSSNVSGFDCIPQVVQKNYEPEFSYISVVLFNKLNFVRRNLVFQGSVKSHQWSLYCWSIFCLFLRNRQLSLVLDGKSLQKFPINVGVSQSWSYVFPTMHR